MWFFSLEPYCFCALPWCLLCWQSGVFLWSEGQFPAPQSPLWGNGRSTDQYPEIYTYSQTESVWILNKWLMHMACSSLCAGLRPVLPHSLCSLLLRRFLVAIYWHGPYHKTQRQKQQPLQASCHPWTPLDTKIRQPSLSPFRESGLFKQTGLFIYDLLSTHQSSRRKEVRDSSRKHTLHVSQQMQLHEKNSHSHLPTSVVSFGLKLFSLNQINSEFSYHRVRSCLSGEWNLWLQITPRSVAASKTSAAMSYDAIQTRRILQAWANSILHP